MAGILDRHNRHLLTEESNNQGNSFIANVNKVADNVEDVKTVADNIEDVVAVGSRIDKIETIASNIEDIIKVAILKPSIEAVAAIADDIPKIVSEIETIREVYNSLPKIDSVYENYQLIQNDLARLEALADRLTHDQNELIQLVNDNKTFVSESETKIYSLIDQINAKVEEATTLVSDIQGIKDDIDAALRDALLPVVTEEIVENASERAAQILESQFAGNTDFVQTYIDTYNGE